MDKFCTSNKQLYLREFSSFDAKLNGDSCHPSTRSVARKLAEIELFFDVHNLFTKHQKNIAQFSLFCTLTIVAVMKIPIFKYKYVRRSKERYVQIVEHNKELFLEEAPETYIDESKKKYTVIEMNQSLKLFEKSDIKKK